VKREGLPTGATLRSYPPLRWIDNDGNLYGRLNLQVDDVMANDWEVRP